MKEYLITINGREIKIIQDDDGKFIKPYICKNWKPYGTALKPAYEPVIVARKPISESNIAENCLKWGVGGINIDECRVEFEKTQNPATNPLYRQQNKDKYKQIEKGQESNGAVSFTSSKNDISSLGRFPTNIITDGSDEVASGMPYSKGSDTKELGDSGFCFDTDNRSSKPMAHGYVDKGSAMRYFYSAKASKKDRDDGLDEFESKQMYSKESGNQFGHGNKDGDNFGDRIANITRKNIHPTVKPVELMQYLVRLVTPKGETILDIFNGSGSTGKAVAFENRERNANYKYIGIELEPQYCEISKMRIHYAIHKYKYDMIQDIKKDEIEKGQLSLFDWDV